MGQEQGLGVGGSRPSQLLAPDQGEVAELRPQREVARVEVFPESPWNYGLVLDPQDPAKSFTFERKPGPVPAQPFTREAAPIQMKVKARKIPGWAAGRPGHGRPPPAKPGQVGRADRGDHAHPDGRGAPPHFLLPDIGTGPDAHEWVAAPKPKASRYKVTASFCCEHDTVEAAGDGLEPSSSNDQGIPRFTWWSHQATPEWIQYDFEKPLAVSSASVYWFDDTGTGRCRVPQSWKLLRKDGEAWKPVEATSDFGTKRDAWNVVKFKKVETTALRIEVQLQPDVSGASWNGRSIEPQGMETVRWT